MALKLYLDDCSNSDLLADLLRQVGHEVVRPNDENVGLTGEDDDVHFAFAAARGLTLITKNPADFKALHELDPRHAGILAVYQDNDPSRDMSNPDILRAIRNIEEAAQHGGPQIHGEFHILNDWRGTERIHRNGYSGRKRQKFATATLDPFVFLLVSCPVVTHRTAMAGGPTSPQDD